MSEMQPEAALGIMREVFDDDATLRVSQVFELRPDEDTPYDAVGMWECSVSYKHSLHSSSPNFVSVLRDSIEEALADVIKQWKRAS